MLEHCAEEELHEGGEEGENKKARKEFTEKERDDDDDDNDMEEEQEERREVMQVCIVPFTAGRVKGVVNAKRERDYEGNTKRTASFVCNGGMKTVREFATSKQFERPCTLCGNEVTLEKENFIDFVNALAQDVAITTKKSKKEVALKCLDCERKCKT